MPRIFDDFDHAMMTRALTLARRGEGRVEPNPMVGCVVARNQRIIGQGYHRRFGGPHAEVEALRSCTSGGRGATVYVTLEPCCHQGKTPPCTEALLEAGVARVVAATGDPGPQVHGRGFTVLRAAGIGVDVGLLEPQALELIAPYLVRLHRNRPYVIAKWAQSIDGKLATRTGDSQWISCAASRRLAHRLRARVDAIIVGSGTVLRDDPTLSARGVVVRRRALRVVLDARLRIPETSQVVVTAAVLPSLVMTTSSRARSPKASRLRARGVEIIGCRLRRRTIALDGCLEDLAGRNATNVLVEGGPTLLSAFLQTGLVDEAFVFTAPILVGGDLAPSALGGKGAALLESVIAPSSSASRSSGRDVLHRLRFN